MERLSGGLINDIQADSGCVIKAYNGDSLISTPFEQRIRRERWALNRFGGSIAPALYETTSQSIRMERIDGQPVNDILKTGERDIPHTLFLAGEKLKEIHQPIWGSIEDHQKRFIRKAEKYFVKSIPVWSAAGIDPENVMEYIHENTKPEKIQDFGVTAVHRDYWLNNTLYQNGTLKSVIDWELSGIGSPYEDFAIVDLWITRIHGHKESFWNGYGKEPRQESVNAFLLAKMSDFLSTTTPEALEDHDEAWFYWDTIRVAKEIL